MMPSRAPEDPRLTRVGLRRELVEEGWSDRTLAAAVRAGVLAKVRRGAYVDGPMWRALDARGQHELRTRAVLARTQSDLVVSHVSGLVLHGNPEWGLDLREVHVTRTDEKGARRESGICPHRGHVEKGDVTHLYGVPVMEPTRLAIEITTILSSEASLVHVNDLLHRGLTTREQIIERYQRSMEHWPESLAFNVVARLMDRRCESVGESRTLHLCWRQRLPLPIVQYPIRDETGRIVYTVDFAWPELGVFLEFDGKVKYSALLRVGESPVDVVLREKMRESRVCRLTGWRCIRIVWADLERPEATALAIRRELFPDGAAA